VAASLHVCPVVRAVAQQVEEEEDEQKDTPWLFSSR
jgi:hypothetical protein